jgi:hypothetical protein
MKPYETTAITGNMAEACYISNFETVHDYVDSDKILISFGSGWHVLCV